MDNKRKKEIRVGDLVRDAWYEESVGIVLKVNKGFCDVFWIKIPEITKICFEKDFSYEYAERIDQ